MASFGNDSTLVPTGTVVTASGTGTAFEIDDKGHFRGSSVVAAATGTTPSLTVNIQTSYDNGVTDSWVTVASFPAQTAAGTTPHQRFDIDRWVRATWTVSGTTPSITFGVAGEVV